MTTSPSELRELDDGPLSFAAVVAADFSDASVKSYITYVSTKFSVFQGQWGQVGENRGLHMSLFGLTLHDEACPMRRRRVDAWSGFEGSSYGARRDRASAAALGALNF